MINLCIDCGKDKSKKVEDKMAEAPKFKIFDLYDVSSIEVKDAALKPYMNLRPSLLLKSQGRRNQENLGATKVNVVERIANRLAVSGHVNKKHKIITNWSSGKYNRNMKTVLEVLALIEKRSKKNPVQVLVSAIENASPRDEITVIEQAGARYPQAVDTSPIRRINLAIRWMIMGAYGKSFGKKNKIAQTLANEIFLASEGNMESFAMGKKNEAEKQADSAR
ncbi:30S ribosomal protein S7 [Candidatus Pacearchaeota archaeon CG10_big_fil_rev_8_21_14_0_10_31_24]|nr:MAG: 30S ribosomal protein S7 [Candidatus Pacearchaeota archaeon CG10_big_fil_rev_8_21_14_0_10_31_24]